MSVFGLGIRLAAIPWTGVELRLHLASLVRSTSIRPALSRLVARASPATLWTTTGPSSKSSGRRRERCRYAWPAMWRCLVAQHENAAPRVGAACCTHRPAMRCRTRCARRICRAAAFARQSRVSSADARRSCCGLCSPEPAPTQLLPALEPHDDS